MRLRFTIELTRTRKPVEQTYQREIDIPGTSHERAIEQWADPEVMAAMGFRPNATNMPQYTPKETP